MSLEDVYREDLAAMNEARKKELKRWVKANYTNELYPLLGEEDLFSEAMFVLYWMMDQYLEEYCFKPGDFRRLLQKGLKNKLISLLRFNKSRRRVHLPQVESYPPEEMRSVQFPDPEEVVLARERAERLEEAIWEGAREMTDAQAILFLEMVFADRDPEDPDLNYKRIPKKVSHRMTAKWLDWRVSKVRRELEGLHKVIRKVVLKSYPDLVE